MSERYLLSLISVGLSLSDIKSTFSSLPSPIPSWIQYIIVAPEEVVKILKSENLIAQCDYVVDNKHGVYSAMNLGIDVSKGSYLWFLNSGDFWCYSSFDDLFLVLLNSSKKNIGFILGRPVFYKLFIFISLKKHSFSNFFLIVIMLFQVMPICHQNILISRDLHPHFQTIYSLSADFNLLVSSLNLRSRIQFLPVIFSRSSPGGISDTYRLKVLRERLISSLRNFSFFLSPIIFVVFIIRIFYLALAKFIKFFLLLFH